MKHQRLWVLSGVAVTGGALLGGLGIYLYRQPVQAVRRLWGLALRACGAASRIVLVDGYMAHYYTMGPEDSCEPLLILLHGLGDSAETWWRVLPRLARALPQTRVIALDLPGFGASELRPAGVTIDDEATFLVHFLDALGSERATLVGNSLGGWIAARCAVRYPERVARLVLENSAGVLSRQEVRVAPKTRAEARDFVRRVMGRPMPVPDFLCDAIIHNSQEPGYQSFLAHYNPARDSLDADLARIQAPTTIIWGMADQLLPPETLERFATGIPHARVVRVPDAGHAVHMEAPALVADIISKSV